MHYFSPHLNVLLHYPRISGMLSASGWVALKRSWVDETNWWPANSSILWNFKYWLIVSVMLVWFGLVYCCLTALSAQTGYIVP